MQKEFEVKKVSFTVITVITQKPACKREISIDVRV